MSREINGSCLPRNALPRCSCKRQREHALRETSLRHNRTMRRQFYSTSQEKIGNALRALPSREAQMLRLRFGFDGEGEKSSGNWRCIWHFTRKSATIVKPGFQQVKAECSHPCITRINNRKAQGYLSSRTWVGTSLATERKEKAFFVLFSTRIDEKRGR